MALENKLGIQDDIEPAHTEERLTKQRALELYSSGILDSFETGTFKGLASIHQFLFQDLYIFAGELRTVNLSKGSFRFAPVMYLQHALGAIDEMPQATFDEIVQKYIEMNVAHPFREGNGRATRMWLDSMFKQALGQIVDWSKISREDYLLAMERSPVRDTEIKALLQGALTSELTNRTMLARSIDASYSYEGYSAYNAEDLLSEG